MSSELSRASKKLLKQPAFLIAFAVLLVAAVSLNAATQFMQLHFKKLAVPLAHPLDDIKVTLGKGQHSWICVTKDQLSEETEQELGTHQYIMRQYVRSSALTPGELADFEHLNYHEQLEHLGKLRAKYLGKLDKNVISFAVTYYTGKADTVAHIPERCYTADGYEPTDSKNETWDVKTPLLSNGKLGVRYISFDDQTTQNARSAVRKNVGYLFQTNGVYTSESGEVRLKLQNLFAKYGYYAKVELMVQEADRDAASDSMKDFLRSALPEVEQCLPDWAAVEKMAKGAK